MEDQQFLAMADELEKISASHQIAGFLKSRAKIRPIRVHNLLRKVLGGEGIVKTSSDSNGRRKKLISHFTGARPYLSSAVKAALPAAVVGKIVVGDGPKGLRAARLFAAAGGALGATDRALQNWAQRNKRDPLAKKVLQSSGASPIKII